MIINIATLENTSIIVHLINLDRLLREFSDHNIYRFPSRIAIGSVFTHLIFGIEFFHFENMASAAAWVYIVFWISISCTMVRGLLKITQAVEISSQFTFRLNLLLVDFI
jgi:hypothetical protein